jgi:membrane carboxypeptidase/penicillin-binding protein
LRTILDEPTKAVIASEDGTFLKHNGFDLLPCKAYKKVTREGEECKGKHYIPTNGQECIWRKAVVI